MLNFFKTPKAPQGLFIISIHSADCTIKCKHIETDLRPQAREQFLDDVGLLPFENAELLLLPPFNQCR